MNFAKGNGADFYYEVHGQGEPLILIAGLTCDIGLWAGVLEPLSQHFQVIVFDNRGVGRTHYEGPFSVVEMAEDVVALMDHLKIQKAHILGHSMGGAIAQTVAAFHSERVNKLIISHSLIEFNPASTLAFKHLLHLKEANADIKTLTEASAPWVFSHAFLRQPENIEFLIELNQNAAYPQTTAGYRDQLHALCQFNSRAWLQQIKVPTLVLAGEEDVIAPASESKQMANIIKAAFQLLPGAHVPVAEMPLEYAKVVTDFLG